MKISITTFLLVICFATLVRSQWLNDPQYELHATKGIECVYNLQFDTAQYEFDIIARSYSHHPSGKFFLAMVDWWKIMIELENDSHDKAFIEKLDAVIDQCDSILDKNPDDVTALFFKGGALGFRGRLYANRSSWIKAANDGRLALPIVQTAFRIAPDNVDILLGIGIYNYYAEVIPETFPLVKPIMIFFPSGDKKKGIQQLTKASSEAKYAGYEASYFLMQLYYSYEKQYDKSLAIAKKLFERFPCNVVVHRYIGRSYVSLAKWEEAQGIFSDILSKCDGNAIGYTDAVRREAVYYQGVYEMMKFRFDQALSFFYRCDEISRTLDKEGESGFMSLCNLKIGMIYDVQGKRDLAVHQYAKVLGMKRFENSHELADRYSKTPYTR